MYRFDSLFLALLLRAELLQPGSHLAVCADVFFFSPCEYPTHTVTASVSFTSIFFSRSAGSCSRSASWKALYAVINWGEITRSSNHVVCHQKPLHIDIRRFSTVSTAIWRAAKAEWLWKFRADVRRANFGATSPIELGRDWVGRGIYIRAGVSMLTMQR